VKTGTVAQTSREKPVVKAFREGLIAMRMSGRTDLGERAGANAPGSFTA